jgi:hypothetical protein
MKRVAGWIGWALLLLVLIVLSGMPALQNLERTMARSQGPLLALTIGVTVLGFAVMMGGILSTLMSGGESMTHQEIEASLLRQRDASSLPNAWRASTYRFSGVAAGQQGSTEASFADIKDAWRTGEWRRDSHWRRFYIIAAGATLLVVGMFGIFIVIGPMFIKLIMSGALAYATVRTVWGFARA